MDPNFFPANFWICPEKISQNRGETALKETNKSTVQNRMFIQFSPE